MSRHNSTASRHGNGRAFTGKRVQGRRHLDRCQTSGKLRFRDKREALAALHAAANSRRCAEATAQTTNRHECRTYSCQSCHGWHLTSQESWGDSTANSQCTSVSSGSATDRGAGPLQALHAIRRSKGIADQPDACIAVDITPLLVNNSAAAGPTSLITLNSGGMQ